MFTHVSPFQINHDQANLYKSEPNGVVQAVVLGRHEDHHVLIPDEIMFALVRCLREIHSTQGNEWMSHLH